MPEIKLTDPMYPDRTVWVEYECIEGEYETNTSAGIEISRVWLNDRDVTRLVGQAMVDLVEDEVGKAGRWSDLLATNGLGLVAVGDL